MQALWLQACGAQALPARDAWCRALERQGLEPHSGNLAPSAAGVLLFAAHDHMLRDTLRDITRSSAARVIVVQVGGAELAAAEHWSLLADGAADVIAGMPLDAAAAMVAARIKRWQQVDAMIASPLVSGNLVGTSQAWLQALRQIVETAMFSQANVLIVGESGTGKELAARLIHTLDTQRSRGQLIVLDCTTVMPELAGSEFFGHERGAFTGATGPRDGAFALADAGTLFLDEVGELPPSMQPQLLRVIQERSYKRVGGSSWQRTDFRLVCATHRDLDTEVARGAFRSDLYWRLASCVFRLPPLRQRGEDILPLAERFLAQALGREHAPPMHSAVRQHLAQRNYSGNIRELRQLMGRISSRHVGEGPITVGDLPEDERPTSVTATPDWRSVDFDAAVRQALRLGAGLREISGHAADTAVRVAIGEEEGNLQRAARKLGVTDRALQMRRAGITRP